MSNQEIVLIRKDLHRVWNMYESAQKEIADLKAENERLSATLVEKDLVIAELSEKLVTADYKRAESDQKNIQLKDIMRDMEQGNNDSHVAELYKTIDELQETLKRLNIPLEFYNSPHMSSSTISFTAKQKSKNNRKPKDEHKAPGRQPNHKGSTTPKRESEEVIQYMPDECLLCNSHDIEVIHVTPIRLTDIPPRVPAKTSTHVGRKCRCRVCFHTWNTADKIPDKVEGTEFGANLLSNMSSLLANNMSQGMVRDHFHEFYNINATKSTINNSINALAAAAKPIAKKIRESAKHSKFVKFDEFPYKVKLGNGYGWVAVTDRHVVVHVATSRSRIVLEQFFSEFLGIPMTVDGYIVYLTLQKLLEIEMQRCWAHITRDSEGVLNSTKYYAATLKLHKELLWIFHIAKGRPPGDVSDLESRLYEIVNQHEKLGNKKFATTLRNAIPNLLTFVQHPGMDPTNNETERHIRKLVIKRKISLHIVSDIGMENWSILWTIFLTCRKQGKNIHDVFLRILKGQDVSDLINGV